MEFDLENPLTTFNEHQSETIPFLFSTESAHMPSDSFLEGLKTSHFHLAFRREAIYLILQAQFTWNFSPFIPYLALNYMDRFFSKHEIPQGKPWVLRLLVVSCTSLAAKMKNTHFSISGFQKDEDFVFDMQTIHRMELLILAALNWRMRSITPFSFVNFFISLFQVKDPALTQALKDRASDIIFKSHYEVKLLAFKPSVIAASSLLSAAHELLPMQFPNFRTAILSCECVKEESLLSCFNAMQELVKTEQYDSKLDSVSSMRTTMSALERGCTEMGIKRRKVTGFCNGIRVPFSQIQQS